MLHHLVLQNPEPFSKILLTSSDSEMLSLIRGQGCCVISLSPTVLTGPIYAIQVWLRPNKELVCAVAFHAWYLSWLPGSDRLHPDTMALDFLLATTGCQKDPRLGKPSPSHCPLHHTFRGNDRKNKLNYFSINYCSGFKVFQELTSKHFFLLLIFSLETSAWHKFAFKGPEHILLSAFYPPLNPILIAFVFYKLNL